MSLGGYLWTLRRRIATTPPVADERPVEPPANGPATPLTLWTADDQSGTIRATNRSLPLSADRQSRAEELLRAVLNAYLDPASLHKIPPGSEVRNVFLVESGLAVVDLNAVLANEHRSGILVEELTVASLVQTLASNLPEVHRVRFLVDGKPRDTLAGHVDLSAEFDVGQMGQVVQALGNP
ncbi:MAG: GerMN domain-containing protein [Acidobacteriales bacterium]|nr:GerMN domain-containing protein [Terriglobales bacterium]